MNRPRAPHRLHLLQKSPTLRALQLLGPLLGPLLELLLAVETSPVPLHRLFLRGIRSLVTVTMKTTTTTIGTDKLMNFQLYISIVCQ